MNLTLILLLVLGGVAVLVFMQWKRISKLEEGLTGERRLLEERRDELEKAKKEARDRRDELEESKKQLLEAKNKLTKQKKEREEQQAPRPEPKGQGRQKRETAEAAPAPVIVRVTDQEVAAEHQRTVQKLEDEITALRTELASTKKREEQRARDAEKATRALEAAAAAVPQEVKAELPVATPVQIPVSSAPPSTAASEEIAALKAQLEATKKVAVDRERELKREIRKSQDDAKHALRRAANNQALYAVLHGQLELTEDRLAAYRLKYEGAKSIDEIKREQKRDRPRKQRDRETRPPNGQHAEAAAQEGGDRAAPPTIPPATVPPMSSEVAPSTIEVSKDDIVSMHPSPAPQPSETMAPPEPDEQGV